MQPALVCLSQFSRVQIGPCHCRQTPKASNSNKGPFQRPWFYRSYICGKSFPPTFDGESALAANGLLPRTHPLPTDLPALAEGRPENVRVAPASGAYQNDQYCPGKMCARQPFSSNVHARHLLSIQCEHFYLRRSPKILRKKLLQTICTPKVSAKADGTTMRSKCALSRASQCPLTQSERASIEPPSPRPYRHIASSATMCRREQRGL